MTVFTVFVNGKNSLIAYKLSAFFCFYFANNIHNQLKCTGHFINQNNCWHKNYIGNEQWRAVDSIKHSEKQLPLK